MRKSRLKIHGNDRLLMMLARDVRRRWMQYGLTRKIPKGMCEVCNKKEWVEVDHKEPVGSRPRTPEEFSRYIDRMMNLPTQGLCKDCHLEKSRRERKKRANKNKLH